MTTDRRTSYSDGNCIKRDEIFRLIMERRSSDADVMKGPSNSREVSEMLKLIYVTGM